jgi:hypothetical protein
MSVNSGGQGMMLGMGVGAAEVDYGVAAGTTDVVFTPDFEIRLAGPAHYHFALGVTAAGDTCFKPLLGNTSGVVFSELLGQEIFGAGADETTLFPDGKIARRTALTESCGCPAPPLKQVALEAKAPQAPEAAKTPEAPATPRADTSPAHGLAPVEATAPPSPERSGQTHVEVETPFVFSGNAAPITGSVAKIQFSSLPNAIFTQEDPDPIVLPESPPAPAEVKAGPSPSPTPPKKEKKSFMARVKGFLGGLFHR